MTAVAKAPQKPIERRFAFGPRTAFWLILLAAVGYRWSGPLRDSVWSLSSAQPLADGGYQVQRVIDGDTLVVGLSDSGSTATVRLLGINAPEDTTKKEPFGDRATTFLRERAEGKTIVLEWDKRRVDRYGRRLAYVYADDVPLNEALVRAGLARVFTYPGDSATHSKRLVQAQDLARGEKLGVWSLEDSPRAETLPRNEE